jgi:hypothetical protein
MTAKTLWRGIAMHRRNSAGEQGAGFLPVTAAVAAGTEAGTGEMVHWQLPDDLGVVQGSAHSLAPNGFMDPDGAVVVPAKYKDTEGFTEGYAWVMTDASVYPPLWTVIDRQGTEQFAPLPLQEVFQFNKGWCWIEPLDPVQTLLLINPQGKLLMPDREAFFGYPWGEPVTVCPGDSELWGFVDLTGRMIIEPRFEGAESFREGLAFVKVAAERRGPADPPAGAQGYIDRNGDWVFAVESAPGGSTGRACYDGRIASYSLEHERWGFRDRGGAWVIPPTFVMAQDFIDGRAIVSDQKTGVIDLDGDVIIPFQYDAINAAPEDCFVCFTNDPEYQSITRALDGSLITVPPGWQNDAVVKYGRVKVTSADRQYVGWATLSGQIIWPPRSGQIQP